MRLLAVTLILLCVTPAPAQSLINLVDVGNIFCAGRISGDMTPVTAILTPDLRKLLDGRTDIRWQGTAGQITSCMPVGASGTYDNPESVIYYAIAGAGTASDKLVAAFIDQQLRIDDIAYGTGGTLREEIGE